jgi:glycosyltransferase involved in cell wall biosynthesis
VVVPAHDAAPWLDECLGSVLAQTHAPSQVVVVNDGSTDSTPEVLARYRPRIEVIDQPNSGIGKARNRGLERATGTYVAFLDADDAWHPEKLALQVAHAEANPDLAVVYADAEEFDAAGTVHRSFFEHFPSLRRPEAIFEGIVRLAVPLTTTSLVRRDFLVRHALSFPEPRDISGVEDVGFFLEIADRGGRFGFVDRPLARRRLHPSNISGDHFRRFTRRIALYERLLGTIRRPEHRRWVSFGLRDAHFRVAECHWADLDLPSARKHFRAATGWDRLGLRAALYRAACLLPRGLVRWLRRARRPSAGPP